MTDVLIDVRKNRAYVARKRGEGGSFAYEPCANWQWLETLAVEAVETLGESVTRSGLYPCPDALVTLALWAEDVLAMVSTPRAIERDLGLGVSTVQKVAHEGKIHTRKVGGTLLVFEPEVRERWERR